MDPPRRPGASGDPGNPFRDSITGNKRQPELAPSPDPASVTRTVPLPPALCAQQGGGGCAGNSASPAPELEDEEKEDPCIICQHDLPNEERGIIQCGHVFCFGCIHKWAKKENICPVCRMKFHRITKTMSQREIDSMEGKQKRLMRDMSRAKRKRLKKTLSRFKQPIPHAIIKNVRVRPRSQRAEINRAEREAPHVQAPGGALYSPGPTDRSMLAAFSRLSSQSEPNRYPDVSPEQMDEVVRQQTAIEQANAAENRTSASRSLSSARTQQPSSPPPPLPPLGTGATGAPGVEGAAGEAAATSVRPSDEPSADAAQEGTDTRAHRLPPPPAPPSAPSAGGGYGGGNGNMDTGRGTTASRPPDAGAAAAGAASRGRNPSSTHGLLVVERTRAQTRAFAAQSSRPDETPHVAVAAPPPPPPRSSAYAANVDLLLDSGEVTSGAVGTLDRVGSSSGTPAVTAPAAASAPDGAAPIHPGPAIPSSAPPAAAGEGGVLSSSMNDAGSAANNEASVGLSVVAEDAPSDTAATSATAPGSLEPGEAAESSTDSETDEVHDRRARALTPEEAAAAAVAFERALSAANAAREAETARRHAARVEAERALDARLLDRREKEERIMIAARSRLYEAARWHHSTRPPPLPPARDPARARRERERKEQEQEPRAGDRPAQETRQTHLTRGPGSFVDLQTIEPGSASDSGGVSYPRPDTNMARACDSDDSSREKAPTDGNSAETDRKRCMDGNGSSAGSGSVTAAPYTGVTSPSVPSVEARFVRSAADSTDAAVPSPKRARHR